MPSPRVDIISIGTLSRNLLWNETAVTRTPHATTSLVRAGKRTILVDTALPPPVIQARLHERAGIKPQNVDTVFLTNFRPAHRGGIALFEHATIFMHENEKAFTKNLIESLLDEAAAGDVDRPELEAELEVLDIIKSAPDKLAPGVDLFPLFGYTPGTCGLLVAATTMTLIIAGDAVPTLEHFLAGQTLPDAQDIAAAHEAMGEVYEIADLIVPGHDNIFVNPRTQGM